MRSSDKHGPSYPRMAYKRLVTSDDHRTRYFTRRLGPIHTLNDHIVSAINSGLLWSNYVALQLLLLWKLLLNV